MLHAEFQAPEPSSSGEEDFLEDFIIEPKTTATEPFLTPGHHMNKLDKEPQGNATYQKAASEPSGS